MKILLLGNDLINFSHVNNISPSQNRESQLYRVKVEMVNGSAFYTPDIYTEEQALNKIAEISLQLENKQTVIIQ